MSTENNKKWRNFVELYRNSPELWDTKSEKYKNKLLKNKAYQELLRHFKLIEEDATLEVMKRKINNMRTCYKRELKKQIRSKKSGVGSGDLYEPCLWYFNLFHFLKDVETPNSGTTSLRWSDEEINIKEEPIQKVKRRRRNENKEDHNAALLRTATANLECLNKTAHKSVSQKDEATIYAEGWACSFRKLSEEQKLYAKKHIDEILILGQLNELTFNNFKSSVAHSVTPICLHRASTPMASASAFQGDTNSAHSYESVVENSNISEFYADTKFS